MNDGFLSPPENNDEEKNGTVKPPYQAAIDNSLESRSFGMWGNLRLSRKFLLAFGALFAFTLVIAIVTLNGLNRTQAAYEEALAKGIEIRRLSEQLETSLLQARTNENNFLLRWREEGFSAANNNYAVPYSENIANMRTQIKALTAFAPEVEINSPGAITQSQYLADIASLSLNVDAYEKSFKALVNAYEKKGVDNENTDIESKFRTTAGKIEQKLNGQSGTESGLEKLQAAFFRIRLNEKDYLSSTDTNYITAIRTLIPPLKTQIERTEVLTPAEKVELFAQLDEYLSAINALGQLDREIIAYKKELSRTSGEVESLTVKIKTLGEQLADRSIAEARLNTTQTFSRSTFTVLSALILFILLAVNFSDQLTRPLILLTKIAQEIAEGNFRLYAEVRSADEIGTLTQAINNMTGQLKNALQNLENRAEELKQRAAEIELANQQSKKRAKQFESVAKISSTITSIQNLQELLPRISEVISQQMGFYHVGIFLTVPGSQYAVLSAANSEGGRKMIQRHHKLKIGEQGIVGYVTQTGTPRIALDVGEDAHYFTNPELPSTHSEMALPLKAGDEVIGALDIQSTEIGAFTDEDFNVLSTLADQVSLAIQNARLFDKTKKTLSEFESIQRQYVRKTWGRLPEEENFRGYRYSVAGVVPLDAAEAESTGDNAQGIHKFEVPIILRGETIGTLMVQAPKNERLSTDQMDLAKAVAERVAISAENARLFDETIRRAEREHLVSDITTKIRSTTDPREMIKTAVDELKRALGITGVEIVPSTTVPAPDK